MHLFITEGVKFQLEVSENKDVSFFFSSSKVTDPLTSVPGPSKLNLEGYFRVLGWNLKKEIHEIWGQNRYFKVLLIGVIR